MIAAIHSRRHEGRGGFTLTELLIAMTVFTILMAGLAALFIASINAMKSGNTIIEGNEEARTGLGVIERDLQSAFSAREYGDYYQFYGTPIGMTFIGLVRSYDMYATGDTGSTNLARVSYVLHPQPDPNKASFETMRLRDPLGNGTLEWLPTNLTTYALLRYVEPGVRNLDDFPFDFEALGNEFPEIGSELSDVRSQYSQYPDHIQEAMVQAKKRQLWLRMLSTSPSDDTFPSAWTRLTDSSGDVLEARHFIVAENVYSIVPPGLPGDDDVYFTEQFAAEFHDDQAPEKAFRTAFFEYGLISGHGEPTAGGWAPYWNADYNLPELDEQDLYVTATGPSAALNGVYAQLGTPVNPRLPNIVKVTLPLIYESPHLGAPDHERVAHLSIDVPTGFMRSEWRP